ncbi:MAG: PleD family two-component system response regulator [Promethearchaeota archaeon]
MSSLILIVDDNNDILLNLQVTLEFNDYKVISAENGKQAIKVLRKLNQLPALIISDIMMPEMNGYELFSAVSENPIWNHIPFLFLSAYSPEKKEIVINEINEADIIIKPFKDEELLRNISKKIILK